MLDRRLRLGPIAFAQRMFLRENQEILQHNDTLMRKALELAEEKRQPIDLVAQGVFHRDDLIPPGHSAADDDIDIPDWATLDPEEDPLQQSGGQAPGQIVDFHCMYHRGNAKLQGVIDALAPSVSSEWISPYSGHDTSVTAAIDQQALASAAHDRPSGTHAEDQGQEEFDFRD